MKYAKWRFIQPACTRRILPFLSTPIALAIYSQEPAIRLDSKRDAQWPSTRPVIEETNLNKDHATAPGPDDDNGVPLFADEDSAAWASFSSSFANARDSLYSIRWSALSDNVARKIVPEWAQSLPNYVAKLQRELQMGPGSLADEVWQEAQDPYTHPEIMRSARVRIGKDLCAEELAFVERRKKLTAQALARYLDISEDVHPDDVPTIAVCGSGGGLRALVAGASSYLSAQEAGLFDCATYTAGVSGSCWLQTLYNSSIGGRRHEKVIEHLKKRIGVHIAYPPSFLELFTRAPTNKFLLSGSVEKLKGDPSAVFGLVDVYGLLLATRLMIPHNELGVDDRDLKLSNQSAYLAEGAHPLPIYAAVRHEIPLEKHETKKGKAQGKVSDSVIEKVMQEAWFQWFEFTPYELWCEELESGIPTWSIGRHFSGGIGLFRDNSLALPEMRIPFMMGIWGSAFCATLAHYYKEVRPVIRGLKGFGGIDDLIEEKDDDLTKIHPIEPGTIPNFALGLEDQLPRTCPESVFKDSHWELMDAGMSNNLPLYPLLRKGRDVDIIVCFDASADIKTENWLSAADGYAKQRGVKGWPIGAGWPRVKDETKKGLNAADAITAQEAAGRIADSREEQRMSQNSTDDTMLRHQVEAQGESDLGYCNVWVGSLVDRKSERESPQSSRVDSDTGWKLLEPDAGLTVIYFPFMPNPKVKGVDPNVSAYLSTWNFTYTPEEIDQVVALARANFEAGKDQTKRTVRAVYERKKAKRIGLEGRSRFRWWKRL